MKNIITIALSVVLALLFSASYARAEIVRLLDCQIEGSPIPYASLYSYMGGLWLITTDREGETKRTKVSEQHWERKLLYLAETPDLRGVLFFRDDRWHYTFKGDGGWYMAGQAHCQE